MQQSTSIGLDVHKETVAVAVLRPGESECEERVIASSPEALRRLIARLPDRAALRSCYGRGPPATTPTACPQRSLSPGGCLSG